MKFSVSGTRLISWDTLNKVTTTGWPNVFNNESQLLEHRATITHVCSLQNDVIASISGNLSEQTLIISSSDGQVLRELQVSGVIDLASYGQEVVMLKSDGTFWTLEGQIEIDCKGNQVVFANSYAIGIQYDHLSGSI